MKFILTTDTSCDERKSTLDELNIPWVPMTFTIDGDVYPDNFSTDGEYQDFYKKVEAGAAPVTSQITPQQHEDFFEKVIKEKNPDAIVHLSLSGGLSSSASSAKKGAEDCMRKHPKVKIYAIDTLLATQAHNILLYEAIRMRDENMSAEEAVAKLEEIKMCIQPWFMVDDLHHLRRGGRVSGVQAVFGTLLNIKPILIIEKDGSLKVVNKVKGTRKAIEFFVEMIKSQSDQLPKEIYVIQANAMENAELLKKRLNETYPEINVKIGWLGPIIGSHCGSGMLGLSFIGRPR